MRLIHLLVRDDSAVAAPIAFLLAGALAIAAIGVIAVNTSELGSSTQTEASEAENLRGQAESMLDLLLLSPGYQGAGAQVWDSDDDLDLVDQELEIEAQADDVTRLGLLEAGGSRLDLLKFRNLKDSPFEAATDGYVNYEEARAQFGLDEQALDFHVRAYPTLPEVQEILEDGLKDPNLRVTYIGNLDTEEASVDLIKAGSGQCEKSGYGDKGTTWRFSVDVTNVGTSDTQFQVFFDIDGDGDDKVEVSNRKDQTGLVLVGATETVWVDVANKDVSCSAGTKVTVSVYDPSKKLDEQTLAAPLQGDAAEPALDDFFTEASSMQYAVGEQVSIDYFEAEEDETLSVEVWDGADKSGNNKADFVHTVPKKSKDHHFEVDTTGWAKGAYTVYVEHDPSGVVSTQRVLIDSDPAPEFVDPDDDGSGPTFDPAMKTEVGFLNDVVENFCPAHHDDKTQSVLDGWDGTQWENRCKHLQGSPEGHEVQYEDQTATGEYQSGDVLWDGEKLLQDEVCKRLQYVASNGKCQANSNTPRLDITNVLVVGSNVDHSEMTKGQFTNPLRDWVEAGGLLIVFGSPDGTTQWMKNIFKVGDKASSGSLNTPDVNHPLLTVSDQLNYHEYDNKERAWDFAGNSGSFDEYFGSVVKQGDDPVTAISDPGAFGEGTVIITTWLPYDIFGDGSATAGDEGRMMVNNFLMQGYRDLFLDYGPEIPRGVEVIPAFKRAQIEHDEIGLVDLDIALYVFPGG